MKFAVVVAVIMVTSAGCHRDVEVDRPDCDSAVCQLADRLADVGGGVIIGGEAPIGDVSLLGGTASTFAPTGSLLFDDRERVIWTVREGNVVEAINIAEGTSSKVSIGPRVEFAGVLHSGGVLVRSSDEAGVEHSFQLRVVGENAVSTPAQRAERYVASSTDGSEFTVMRDGAGHDRLLAISAGGPSREVPLPGACTMGLPMFSPDSKLIAVGAGCDDRDSGVYVVERDSLKWRLVAKDGGYFGWSPDSSALLTLKSTSAGATSMELIHLQDNKVETFAFKLFAFSWIGPK